MEALGSQESNYIFLDRDWGHVLYYLSYQSDFSFNTLSTLSSDRNMQQEISNTLYVE